MKIVLVVGARPNFMKAAPVMAALEVRGAEVVLVHTGQHFDANMSKVFFQELGLPEPNHFLGVGGTTRAMQFGEIVKKLADVLTADPPDRVLVVGDVTSTAAGAVAADCVDIPVDHVEAGLRSFDDTMPEERNRRITDVLADRLYCSEPSGVENLVREGHDPERVHHVGNVMIDTLDRYLQPALAAAPWTGLGLERGAYAVFTAHRPANVDDPVDRTRLLAILRETLERMPVVFPLHPRTAARLAEADRELWASPKLIVREPMGYHQFLGLTAGARVCVTDSGGLQEEATVLQVPCIVMRTNTERPAALTSNGGSGTLVGLDLAAARACLDQVAAGTYPRSTRPALWDGHAAPRIAALIAP